MGIFCNDWRLDKEIWMSVYSGGVGGTTSWAEPTSGVASPRRCPIGGECEHKRHVELEISASRLSEFSAIPLASLYGGHCSGISQVLVVGVEVSARPLATCWVGHRKGIISYLARLGMHNECGD